MRSIHTNIQPSSPFHLLHHSQTHKHFNLMPSLPQHIQVYTYCCLPTRQQPHQLSCMNLTTQPFTKQHTPRGSFQCASHCSTCTCISNGLLLTHSTPQMKQNPLLTTLPATQKNLFTWFSATLSQTIYRRYQQKSCTRGECFTADDILTSFVIYYRTDARQHVIYLLKAGGQSADQKACRLWVRDWWSTKPASKALSNLSNWVRLNATEEKISRIKDKHLNQVILHGQIC